MPETGYSMIKSYRRCPKQFQYKYVRHLQRRKPAAPLLRGTILHEMLNARAAVAMKAPGLKPSAVIDEYARKFNSLFREEKDIYGEDFVGDIKRVYEGYERTWADDGWKYEASEEFVATDLTKELRFVGHLDKRIVTPKDGRRWLVDHKSHKNIPDESARFSDYQILLYLWAYNREHKDKVDGIIWDYLRTKPPRVPEVLKNGQLSQAQNIDTDYHTYARELRRLQLDPRPYEDFLNGLKKRSATRFFLRVPLPAPSKALTESVVEDFRQTSIIMHGLKVYPRTMTRECSYCEYYRLCNAELRGLDSKFIEKSEYEEKPIGDYSSEEE